MAAELDELVEFLGAARLEVRKMAVDIVLGLTGSADGIQSLAKKASDVAPALLYLLKDQQSEIAKSAAEALVNLSEEKRIAMALIYGGAIELSMELISKTNYSQKRPLVMLLANLTILDEGTSRLLQEGDEKRMGSQISKLVYFFSRSTDSDTEADAFEHIASILANVTRQREGRRLLLEPERGLLRQMLPQMEAESAVRQRGVAGAVRNCCFEAPTSLPALLLASQFLWPALLLPLAGPKPYSREDRAAMPPELAVPLAHERLREADPAVRVAAAEALSLIAMQEAGRRALWSVNAPRIFQVGYEEEENEEVIEAYERLGSLFVTGGPLEEPAGGQPPEEAGL